MLHVEPVDRGCRHQAMPILAVAVMEALMGIAPQIVLVEDERPLRMIIARNLQKRGYDVVEAGTGAAALTALRARPPGLLLLDINLPDMTGWDVLRALPIDLRQRIPTIVLSAVAPNPTRLNEFHGVAFLHKPFPLDTLLRLVADRLGGGQASVPSGAWR